MYLEYFGLREKPFTVTPDPRFFYTNPVYQEAYAGLLYGIRERNGFLVLTGEVGTGKTTLLRKLMGSLEETTHFAFFYNTNLSFDELLQLVCEDFGLTVTGRRRVTYIQALNTFLLERLAAGGTGVLFIDEAQNLDDGVLEDLRLLSNLETVSEKLLQIVLVGQPELEQKLSQPKLRQLKQRVAIQCKLDCLKEREVWPFIHHRLQTVGYEGPELFPPETLERIGIYSRGIPRLINIICDNALLIAYSTSQPRVSTPIIEEVARDLQLRVGSVGSRTGTGLWMPPPKLSFDGRWQQEEPQITKAASIGPIRTFAERPQPPQDDIDTVQAPASATKIMSEKSNGAILRSLVGWLLYHQPRRFVRVGAGIFFVLLLLGGAGAAIYPQQTADRLSDLGFQIGGLLEVAEGHFASLGRELHIRLAVPSTGEAEQDRVKELFQRKPTAASGSRPQRKSEASLDTQSLDPRRNNPATEEYSSSFNASSFLLAEVGNQGGETKKASFSPPSDSSVALLPEGEKKGQLVIIRPGSTLSALVREAYGNNNILALDLIKEFNPQLQDIDQIIEGETLWLPSLSRETLLREQPDGSYHLILASFRKLSEAERFARIVRRQGYVVVISPQQVSDDLVLRRVKIKGLRDSAAIDHAWDLVDIKDVLPEPTGIVSATNRVVP